jgi:hypothetical protein
MHVHVRGAASSKADSNYSKLGPQTIVVCALR